MEEKKLYVYLSLTMKTGCEDSSRCFFSAADTKQNVVRVVADVEQNGRRHGRENLREKPTWPMPCKMAANMAANMVGKNVG